MMSESYSNIKPILIVEDNVTNRNLFSLQLLQFGIATPHGLNGRDALELVRANPYAFSMILMDLQMPVVDGLEAMRRLRADPRFVTTSIIALTALAMPGDREYCITAGANEYMSKSVSLKKLRATINEMLGKV
jgi:CheY-like chemotaxis protein